MVTIKIDSQEFQFPQAWNELTPVQLDRVALIRAEYMDATDEQSMNAARMAAFKFLSGVRFSKFMNITSNQWYDLLPLMNFLFEAPSMEINPLRSIRVGARIYYGPVGMLEGATYKEMIDADTIFAKAANTKSKEDMYLLMAIMWRQKRVDLSAFKRSEKWNGDIRRPYNNPHAKELAKIFERKVSFHIAVLVFLYYWSFRNQMMAQFANLFSDLEDDERQGNNYGWAGPLLEMSGGKFGTITETENTDWFTAMLHLSREMDLAEQREREFNKINNQ